MQRIEIATKPNGSGRNWLEVGHFDTDAFGRKQWVKKNAPHQDRRLKVDRRYSDRAETIDWILLVPDDYPLAIIKVIYDRLSPRKLIVIWEPGKTRQELTAREENINRAFELAADNEELSNLLRVLLAS